jgi:hypothetical protein
MATLISLNDYSVQYDIEYKFLLELEESGIIYFHQDGDAKFITEEQLGEMETYIRFYYDLDINIEGIDVIRHLLRRVNTLEQEIRTLRNQLQLHQ